MSQLWGVGYTSILFPCHPPPPSLFFDIKGLARFALLAPLHHHHHHHQRHDKELDEVTVHIFPMAVVGAPVSISIAEGGWLWSVLLQPSTLTTADLLTFH